MNCIPDRIVTGVRRVSGWVPASGRTLAFNILLSLSLLVAGVAEGQTFKTLYVFTGGADGAYPQFGGLITDASGNIYGNTAFGGSQAGFNGNGVIFKLDANGNESVLYAFTGGSDGSEPQGGLVRDAAGNLYGTTVYGGIQPGKFGSGVIFRIDPSGYGVLHTFDYVDGANPYAPLGRDVNGRLYATTSTGGLHGDGTVVKVDSDGSVIHDFSGPVDGANPYFGVVGDERGNLYGATLNGGDLNGCSGRGCGTIYKIDRRGHLTALYLFMGGPDGANPYSTLIRDPSGNLYGTTWNGGAHAAGTVFKIDPKTNQLTVLYTFTGGADGANPPAGLVGDESGNLYGMTNHAGGSCYCGTVFKLDAQGNLTVLHTFTAETGQWPGSPLILRGRVLYGTTSNGGALGGGKLGTGTVFKITLP